MHKGFGTTVAEATPASGMAQAGVAEARPAATNTGFGGTVGTTAVPSGTQATAGGTAMTTSTAGQHSGFGGGASSGAAGTTFTGQGVTGGEAMGGGVLPHTG